MIELNDLGRLLSYDPGTGRVSVLLDGLYMPNGVVLSPDERFLLLAETSIGRILRYTHAIPSFWVPRSSADPLWLGSGSGSG